MKQKKKDALLTRAYRDLHFLYDANDSIRKKFLDEAAKIKNNGKNFLSLYYSMFGRENIFYGDRKKCFVYCLKALELSKNKDEVIMSIRLVI